MILYHGSKSGIRGEISPFCGRMTCDFGQGFYMGDRPDQPKGLIAGWKDNQFYELECDFTGLKILSFTDDYVGRMDWALYIGYNRGQIDPNQYPVLVDRYQGYNASYDVVAGLIANDKMYRVLDDFFHLNICDKAFLEALSRVKLGRQYVAKTKRACGQEHIKVLSVHSLSEREVKAAKVQEINRGMQNDGIVEQLKAKYRRAIDIKYFDEIAKEWEKKADS
mgnify:FL=1